MLLIVTTVCVNKVRQTVQTVKIIHTDAKKNVKVDSIILKKMFFFLIMTDF